MNIFQDIFPTKKEENLEFLKVVVAEEIPISGMSDINNYRKLKDLGEGTFGSVYKAEHVETKEMFAVKQFKHENGHDLFSMLTMREVKALERLKHPNIIALTDICYSHKYATRTGFKADFYLVFEFCKQDLCQRIQEKRVLKLPEVNSIMKQCLTGMDFIHQNGYIHRDLKPENILLDLKGVVKFADFGWARSFKSNKCSPKPEYTPDIVTLWYRAPELLLHDTAYNQSIDIWSLGCIFVELWTKKTIFNGKCEIDQLRKITQYCGEITKIDWPEGYELKSKCKAITIRNPCSLKQYLADHIEDSEFQNCMISMLSLNPAKRPTACELLDNYF